MERGGGGGGGKGARSCPSRAARLWRRHVDVWLVRLVLLGGSLLALLVCAHIVDLGVVDRVAVRFHCVSPESRRRAEALWSPPYTGNDTRQQLLERFKPVVFMHHKEEYLPTSLQSFVANSSLFVYRDEKVPVGHLAPAGLRDWMAVTPRTDVREPDAFSLLVQPAQSTLRGWPAHDLRDVPFYGQARFVCERPGSDGGELSNTCDNAARGLPAGPVGACDQVRAPGLRPTPGRFWELRYSFLSTNNGPQYILGFLPIGAHLGDLEHVTVRVAADRETVLDVYYGTHTDAEGRWYHPRDVDWINGTHPAVFSALNSHASYPYCGTIRRRGFLRLAFPHDHTDDRGPIWWPRRVVNIDEDDPGFGALMRDYTGVIGSDFVSALTRQEWWCSENDYAIHRFPYIVGA